MAGWVKKNCFVVTAYYRDELYQENETPMKEEKVFFLESEAEKCKAEYEADDDFENVYIEEEVREFWVEKKKMKVKITMSNTDVYVIEHDDKESILEIVSHEVNRGFRYEFIETVCDPKVRYGERNLINKTDIYREAYMPIEYSTYYVEGTGNYTDHDITVYRKAKEVVDRFADVFNKAKNAGSLVDVEEKIVLPDMELILYGGEHCPHRTKREIELEEAINNYRNQGEEIINDMELDEELER